MKIKYSVYAVLALLAFSFAGCDDDPEQEFESTYPVAGEWYVHEYYGNGSNYGPYHLQIFNTANSKDSVWISNIYDNHIKVKAIVNADKTFGITDGPDIAEEVAKVTISGGKIIDTDSVYFDVILYDEDNEIVDQFYTAGRRFTGLEGQ